MSDLEVIALALSAESVGIGSENLLFSKLRTDYAARFPRLIHRTRFNRPRKQLAAHILAFASRASERASPGSQVHPVDSMPCPVVRNSREPRLRVCTESPANAPAKGWSAVDRRYFIGYKLHLVICSNVPFRDMAISPANVHGHQLHQGIQQGPCIAGESPCGRQGLHISTGPDLALR